MRTKFAQSELQTITMSRKDNKSLIDALTASKVYQDYQKSFTEATGLPVSLRPVESWQLPLHGQTNENPLCAFLAEDSRSCSCCLEVQQEISEKGQKEAFTTDCEVGLSVSAVPIRVGDRLIGFLEMGQVFRKDPTEAQFEKFANKLAECQLTLDAKEARDLFFKTKIVSPSQYQAIVGLLTIFAEHIALITNQILTHQQNAEPLVIQKAKQYIAERQTEDLSLGEVAKAVNTSTFHFCKLFRKATGLTFTDYVSRVRIEKAKNLLLNPNLRISEIAYEVGFQSLTHFNRVFKKISGQSPTKYRSSLSID